MKLHIVILLLVSKDLKLQLFDKWLEFCFSGGPCERGEEVGEEARVGAHPGEDKGAAQGNQLSFCLVGIVTSNERYCTFRLVIN